AKRNERRPSRKVAGEEHVELTVVERRLRRDVHARSEVRAVGRDDREKAAAVQLAIDENAHRLRPVGGDPNQRGREVPKRLARPPAAMITRYPSAAPSRASRAASSGAGVWMTSTRIP